MAANIGEGLGFDSDLDDEDEGAPLSPTSTQRPELDQLGTPEPGETNVGTAPAKQEPLIDFKKNPLGAIGLVLTNVSRGIQGRELQTDVLRKQRLAEQQQAVNELTVGVNAIEAGLNLRDKLPAGPQRDEAMSRFANTVNQTLPGFAGIFSTVAQTPGRHVDALKGVLAHGETLAAITGGDREQMLSLARDPNFMKTLNDQADRKNTPEIFNSFRTVGQMLNNTSGSRLLQQAAADGWTISDLRDPQIKKAFGLTDSHIQTIERNQDLQVQLKDFGFVPTEEVKARGEANARLKPLDRVEAEAAATRRAQEGEEMVTFTNGTETVLRPQREAEALEAQGFERLVTGRTPEDIASNARARREAEGAAPINTFVARTLGLPPDTPKSQARAEGLSTDIEDVKIRDLQKIDTGFKNARDVIDRVQQILRENPQAKAFGGRAAEFINNIRADIASVGELFDYQVDFAQEGVKHQDVFDEFGIDSAELQSLVLDLSFMVGVSRGQQGRALSDNDVKRFAKIIGENQRDPQQIETVLNSVMIRFDQAFRNQFETVVGRAPESQLPDIRSAESIIARLENNEIESLQEVQNEIANLTPRARDFMITRLGSQNR